MLIYQLMYDNFAYSINYIKQVLKECLLQFNLCLDYNFNWRLSIIAGKTLPEIKLKHLQKYEYEYLGS